MSDVADVTAGHPSRLSEQLESVRQIVLQLNDIGNELTRAIVDAGLEAVSTNVAIAVLTKLSTDGPARPRDLIAPTGLSRAGLTSLLDRLESSGLITRTYGEIPGDRRGALVTITDDGAVVAAEIALIVERSLDQQRPAIAELADRLARLTRDTTTPGTSGKAAVDLDRLHLLSQVGTALDAAVAGDDPTPGRTAIVLCSAAQPGGTRPKELIERTRLTSGGVSQLLDRLESSGLIRRITGKPPDRRAVVVELTPHGVEHLEVMLARLDRHLGMFSATIGGLDARPT